ncbi:hypothetical protein QFZ27_005010 [Inquilinus ginsengisoli]|uniref:hypothetical protein n=1 Tax=Inquilinus ginsengisoli TaxID=363840 RepID=UPI003D1EB5CF
MDIGSFVEQRSLTAVRVEAQAAEAISGEFMSRPGQVALLMAVLLGACSPAPAIPKAQSADQMLTINDGPTFYIVFFESGSSRLTAASKHAIVFAVADACRHITTPHNHPGARGSRGLSGGESSLVVATRRGGAPRNDQERGGRRPDRD